MRYLVLYGNGIASQPFTTFDAAKAWARVHIEPAWWTITTYYG